MAFASVDFIIFFALLDEIMHGLLVLANLYICTTEILLYLLSIIVQDVFVQVKLNLLSNLIFLVRDLLFAFLTFTITMRAFERGL